MNQVASYFLVMKFCVEFVHFCFTVVMFHGYYKHFADGPWEFDCIKKFGANFVFSDKYHL